MTTTDTTRLTGRAAALGQQALVLAALLTGGSEGIVMLLRMVRSKVMAVALGVEGVGIYSQAVGFAETVTVFSLVGLQVGVLRVFPELRQQDDTPALRRAVWITLGVTTLLGALVVLVTMVWPTQASNLVFGAPQYGRLLWIAAINVPLVAVLRLVQSYFNAFKQVSQHALLSVLFAFNGLLFLVVLVYPYGTTGAVWAFTVAGAATVAVAVWLLFRLHPQLRRPEFGLGQPANRAMLRLMFGYGLLSLIVANSHRFVFLYLRRSIIVDFGLDVNGLVQATQLISNMSITVASAFHMAYSMPRIGELQDRSAIVDEINRTVQMTGLIIGAIVLGVIVLRHLLLVVFFSAEFAAAAPFLIWQSLGDFFFAVGMATGIAAIYQASKTEWLVLGFTRVVPLFAAYHLVTAVAGPASVNVAYFVSSFLYAVVSLIITRRALDFTYSRRSRIILGSTVLLGGALLVADQYLTGAAWYAVGAAVLLLWSVLTVTRRDVALLAALGGRIAQRLRAGRRSPDA